MTGTIQMYRGDIEHTGYVKDEYISENPKLIKKYKGLNKDIHTASKSSPVVEDGVIYVGGDTGYLYAIEESKMALKWSFKVRDNALYGIHGTPAIDEKCVYIGAYDGWLYALEKETGALLWESQLGNYIGASPVICDDKILVGVENALPDGYVTCVRRETGHIIFESDYLGDHTHCTPTINKEKKLVFAGANTETFYAISLDTGETVWKYKTEGFVKSTAALLDNLVIFTSWDNCLYWLDQETGRLIGKLKTARRIMSSPSVDKYNKLVYFGSNDKNVYCADVYRNEFLWKFKTGKPVTSSATIVQSVNKDKKIVLIGSYDGYLYGFDASNGNVIFKFKTKKGISSVPVVKNGYIYISSDEGILYILK